MKYKKATKQEILDYLKTERSAVVELELADDIIAFLNRQAQEMTETAGTEVTFEDALGVLLTAFIKEHKDLLVE